MPLETIVNIAASQQNVTVVFGSNCDSSIKRATIEAGKFNGNGMKEFLENVNQRVKGNTIYYNVEQIGERRYEINCN